jgi:signal transduction histidine kinase
MPNQASERLTKMNDRIMAAWEERVVKEVGASVHQTSLALRDSLPVFLEQIATALSTTIKRTDIRIKQDEKERTRVGKKHGDDRAGSLHYTMDQLIFEYHILRQVICDEMEAEAPLSPNEREVIVCAVEQAVNDAATRFSENLRDIQERFTHTLSHDLRGPITAAKLYAELFLRKADPSDPATKMARKFTFSMNRVELMINDLLDAGRLRAGQKLELKFEDCDLEVISKLIAEEANLLNEDRVKVISSGPAKGQWNENAIMRILENLISNALKFSEPKSPITIVLKKDQTNAVVSVHNCGKVIPAEDKDIIFEQYRKSKTIGDKKGWGLGLVVVKGLTKSHGGHSV